MAKVLTESEVATIGGTSTSYDNRCCTKARAEELGCTVTEPSGAISNQLITGVTAVHQYVEIGGIKWATMNIGASKVTDYGLYFQCGDTQGYTASQVGSGSGQKYFSWADYKYSNDDGSVITKYNSTDGKTILDASDDAATAAWGSSWRMPTKDEFKTLTNSVNTTWTTDYQGSGIAGSVCTDKTDSSKILFFPACGSCLNGSVTGIGQGVFCWTSSLENNTNHQAFSFLLMNQYTIQINPGIRCNGFSVRAVMN